MQFVSQSTATKELLRAVIDAQVFLEITDRLMADAAAGKPVAYPTAQTIAEMRSVASADFGVAHEKLLGSHAILRQAIQRQFEWNIGTEAHSGISLAPIISQLDLPYSNVKPITAVPPAPEHDPKDSQTPERRGR